MKKIGYFLSRRYYLVLFFLVILISLIILLNSQHRYFNIDELEHVHAAWYVENNHIPYLDFFENHNPLLWYLIAPFLMILGDSTQAMMILRLLMFVFVLGIGYFTYRVAAQVSRSKESALIAVLMMFSLLLFVESAIEIRPDVPQVFFGLVSFSCLVRYFQGFRDRDAAFSGLAAAIAFLFIQKFLFLFLGLILIFAYWLVRRRISLRPIIIFLLCFSFPLLFFVAGLAVSGALKDYLLLGWLFNLKFITSFSAWETLATYIKPNILFWLILPVSVIFILREKRSNPEIKTVALLGAGLFLLVFRVKHPYPQYFLPSLPFFAIAAGYFLNEGFNRFRLNNLIRVIILVALLAEPVVFLVKKSRETNADQLALINYVLRNTQPGECVYDGSLQFNLFRPDLHYFWFHHSPWGGLDQYRRLAQNKYFARYIIPERGQYDVCGMIKAKKPKYILGFTYVQEKCGLKELYAQTEFEKIKVRKDGQSGSNR
ncbi:MAG: glycosyltransferase family 39 protein [Proteobacteria bacterium]|nr:glycosyltransferase family 39 protein [Pseudomonadota bacterium]